MLSYSHRWPPFGTSKFTRSIHTSWSMPLCLGLIQFLQLAAKEHKNNYQNNVDDDEAGAMAMTDVMIAVNNNAAPLVMAMMTGMPEAIAVMVMRTILLTSAPANVTISWTMTTNDDDGDADIGDDGKDSVP
jgi:hypothetical protein